MLFRFRAIAITAPALACLALGGAPARASSLSPFIDFRSQDFAGAHGRRTYTADLDGHLVVHVEAIDPDAESAGRIPQVYWDGDRRDGLGVDRAGLDGDERDEIDQLQQLVVTFPERKLILREIVISDLFNESTHSGEPEFGYYVLNDGNPYTRAVRFDAGCDLSTCRFGDPDNGELILSVDGAPEVSKITFFVNLPYLPPDILEAAATQLALREFGGCFGSEQGESSWTCGSADADADGLIGGSDFSALRGGLQAAVASAGDPLDPFSQVSEFSLLGLDGQGAAWYEPAEYGSVSVEEFGVAAAATPEPSAAVVFAASLAVVSWSLRRRGARHGQAA